MDSTKLRRNRIRTPTPPDGTTDTAAWQAKLLPFMMTGLAVMALLFFLGTFWNYAGLASRLELHEPEITVALEKLQNSTTSPAYQDWYMRVVLEDRALRSRHHQNTSVIESRVWTRFMGFMTGMMMVLCGCIFILGKLEAQFDGKASSAGAEGAMKTNSPGLVLAVVGSVLIAVSLAVNVTVEVIDRPVFLADLGQPIEQPAGTLPPPSPLPSEVTPVTPSAAGSNPPVLPAALAREMCKQAGRPADCMK